ncbi:hypothetical protein V8F33_008816 [Rhypophila sp. PSN 637]
MANLTGVTVHTRAMIFPRIRSILLPPSQKPLFAITAYTINTMTKQRLLILFMSHSQAVSNVEMTNSHTTPLLIIYQNQRPKTAIVPQNGHQPTEDAAPSEPDYRYLGATDEQYHSADEEFPTLQQQQQQQQPSADTGYNYTNQSAASAERYDYQEHTYQDPPNDGDAFSSSSQYPPDSNHEDSENTTNPRQMWRDRTRMIGPLTSSALSSAATARETTTTTSASPSRRGPAILDLPTRYRPNILIAYQFLCERYVSPSDTEIILVGFSRGAFTARVLAALISDMGVLSERGLRHPPSMFKRWKTQRNRHKDLAARSPKEAEGLWIVSHTSPPIEVEEEPKTELDDEFLIWRLQAADYPSLQIPMDDDVDEERLVDIKRRRDAGRQGKHLPGYGQAIIIHEPYIIGPNSRAIIEALGNVAPKTPHPEHFAVMTRRQVRERDAAIIEAKNYRRRDYEDRMAAMEMREHRGLQVIG